MDGTPLIATKHGARPKGLLASRPTGSLQWLQRHPLVAALLWMIVGGGIGKPLNWLNMPKSSGFVMPAKAGPASMGQGLPVAAFGMRLSLPSQHVQSLKCGMGLGVYTLQ